MVVPNLQGDDSGGVGDGPFQIGLAPFRFAVTDRLKLGVEGGLKGTLVGGGQEITDGLGSTEPDHVLHGLEPKEKKSLRGISEMTVPRHLDETTIDIMINLATHLGFDLLENLIRIRH